MCKEATQHLENIIYNTLANEVLEREELMEYVIKIIDESDEAIDLDNPHKIFENTNGYEYMTGIYPYVVEDGEGEQCVGGKIYVCIEVEIIKNGTEEGDDEVLRVLDIDVYCESMEVT